MHEYDRQRQQELVRAMRHIAFLDRQRAHGPLSPDDAEALSGAEKVIERASGARVLPAMREWLGGSLREVAPRPGHYTTAVATPDADGAMRPALSTAR